MGGIHLPDMEVPTKCPCELIGDGYDMYCFAVCGIPARFKEYDECCENGTKPSWCPVLPAADAVEERHGHWIRREGFDYENNVILGACSKCDWEVKDFTNYCPNCGAKMDGIVAWMPLPKPPKEE